MCSECRVAKGKKPFFSNTKYHYVCSPEWKKKKNYAKIPAH